jgi:peptidoglycan hydrolase CwlO-like protein
MPYRWLVIMLILSLFFASAVPAVAQGTDQNRISGAPGTQDPLPDTPPWLEALFEQLANSFSHSIDRIRQAGEQVLELIDNLQLKIAELQQQLIELQQSITSLQQLLEDIQELIDQIEQAWGSLKP